MSAFPGDLTCDGPSSQWPAAPDQSMKTALSSSRLSAAPHGAWASAPARCGHTLLWTPLLPPSASHWERTQGAECHLSLQAPPHCPPRSTCTDRRPEPQEGLQQALA